MTMRQETQPCAEPIVVRETLIEGYPLSPQQRRIWQLAAQGHVPKRAHAAADLVGEIAPVAFAKAISVVMQRHELLRTRFLVPQGSSLPLQVVGAAPRSIEVQSPEVLAVEIDDTGLAAAFGVLDLALSTRLLPDSDEHVLGYSLVGSETGFHRWLVSVPAMWVDASGLEQLLHEILAAYRALTSGIGPQPSLPAAIEYVDVADWLNELLVDPARHEARAYWRDAADKTPILLPSEHASAGKVEPVSHTWALPLEVAQRAAMLAGQLSVPLEVVLLAAWHCLLFRLSGETVLSLNLLCAGRDTEELRSTPGPLTRSLPYSERIDPDATFAIAVRNAAALNERLVLWQHYYDPAQASGESGISFEFRAVSEASGTTGPGLRAVTTRTCADNSRLRLSLVDSHGLIKATITLDASCFPRSQALALARQFETLLNYAVLSPDTPASRLEVMDAATLRWLIHDCNATSRRPVQSSHFHELFEAQAARTPSAVAVTDGDQHLRYSDLNARANQLARYLQSLGAGLEVMVGVCVPRSADLIVCLLAVAKSGAAYVPLDPAYPSDRLQFMVEDTAMPLLLTTDALAARFAECMVRTVCVDRERPSITGHDQTDLGLETRAHQLAYVIYTSGSTGRPKGVLIEHCNLSNYLAWATETYEVASGSGAPVHTSISFDATITSLFPPLLVGATVRIIGEGDEIEQLRALLLGGERYSLFKITPAHLDALSHIVGNQVFSGGPAFFVVGGEALSGSTAEFWRRQAPSTRIINEYGPTETVVGCCVYEVPATTSLPASIPIGRPIANTSIHLLDAWGQLVPPGAIGEIYIGGAGVGRGYHRLPEVTEQRFVPDPFGDTPDARLYRTGDVARRAANGDIEYLGRNDNQVKLRGFRIELGEIEAHLMLCAGVTRAVVLYDGGQGASRLIAFLCLQAGDTARTEMWRRHLEQALPDYMVPALMIVVGAIPLTVNGKIDRSALLELANRQRLERATYVAPETVAQNMLARIWSDVLGIERIGLDDNFFELGGDSIRGIRIVAQLKQEGYGLPLSKMFELRTLAAIADELQPGHPAPAVTATAAFDLIDPADRAKMPAGIEDAYPVSQLQLGMLFYSAYFTERRLYLDADSIHLLAPLQIQALRDTLQVLAKRHEILRTSFALSGYSEPLQLVHSETTIELQIDDWRDRSREAQEQAVRSWLETEHAHRFVPDVPGLLRFHVGIRTDDAFQLGFSRHHAILDGWSAATLMVELAQEYGRRCGARAAPLGSPPKMRFRDFIALEGDVAYFAAARRFWVANLAGATVPELPRARQQMEAATGKKVGNKLRVSLGAIQSAALCRIAREAGTSVKTVLLAAHLRVLAGLTNTTDVLTGLVSNGRPEETDAERTLGLFLNTIPLRVTVAGGTWRQLIQDVFEAEVGLLPYRRYPLASIQAATGLQPRVLFNFVHFHVYDQIGDVPGFTVLDALSVEETNFLLMVHFGQDPKSGEIVLELHYDAVELPGSEIERYAAYYQNALSALASDPGFSYERQSLLSGAEEQQMLKEWNATGLDYPATELLHELFEAQARRTPDAVAVVWGAERISFGELDVRAERLASHLRQQGSGGAGSIIGLCLDRSIDLIVALLAVLKTGAAYVPLDPAYPLDRNQYMLEDARADRVIVHARWADRFTGVPLCVIDRLGELPAAGSLVRGCARDLAYVIYTSGSTGRPKGVAIEHRSAVALLYWARDIFDAGQRAGVLASTSICFDLSIFELFLPLSWGGRVILVDNILQLPTLPAETGVTLVNTVPSAMAELVRGPGLPASVQVVALAGEPLPNALAQAVYGCGVEAVYNLYGPSEDTTYSTYARIERGSDRAVTIGRPIANTRLYLLDGHGQPVPVGVAGELYIGGDGLARGYLNRPELTAERFIQDPYGASGSRVYRTGDLGRYRADGEVEFLGRLDHQVKIRGYRIELGEIEATLLRLDGISEAVVVARDDAGTGHRQLVGYWVGKPGDTPDHATLREHLKRSLPDYMVPAHLVVLPAMPLNANGKIDRKALPAPEQTTSIAGIRRMAVTPTEIQLAALWAELLEQASIGIDEPFFDLGGHSLLVMRMHGRLGELFRTMRPINLVDLFVHTTVASLARHIDGLAGTALPRPNAVSSDTNDGIDAIQERARKQRAALADNKNKRIRGQS